MKVAIDLRPLQIGHQNRGVGAYLLNIIKYFPYDDVEYVFLRYDCSNPIDDYGIGANRIYREITYRKYDFKPRFIPFIKFLYGLVTPKFLSLLFYQPDIFFQTDYQLGIPSKLVCRKRIITCYDLIPYRLRALYIPNWQHFARLRQNSPKRRLLMSIRAYYYQKKYRRGLRILRRADKIISISNTTSKDLVDIASIKETKIKTIYLAPSFRDVDENNITNVVLPKNPYLFYIGGSDKRRQVQFLVAAFNKLNARGKCVDLVLAGNEFSGHSKHIRADIKASIKNSSYINQIYTIGAIDEKTKYTYIKNALALVFPSLYEGFGMPIVESMRLGTTVIAYDNSAIREIGSNLISYAKENNSDGIFDTVIDLIDSGKNIQRLEKAQKLSQKFSWNKTGKQTIDFIFS